MNHSFELILSNKEWLFSGIGVAILSLFIAAFLKKEKPKPQKANTEIRNNQEINQISKAANIYQAGGDINIENPPVSQKDVKPDIRIVSVDVIDDLKKISIFRKQWLENQEDENRGFFPVLDIKLWNKGDGPAFLSHLEIKVNRENVVLDFAEYQAYPASWEYTTLIDPHLEFDAREISISQHIPPNGIDRFVAIIGHEMNYGEFKYIDYRIEPIIHYNEGGKLSLGKHSLRVHSPVNFERKYFAKIRKLDVHDL
jgi:hypothetical protein